MIFAAVGLMLLTGGIFTAAGQPSNMVITAPIYVPDQSHVNDKLPDGILAWDAEVKTVEATNEQAFAAFIFSFTNISSGQVTIIGGRGSCSCTAVQMPPTPWMLPTGGTGEIKATIDLAGKSGVLFKSIIISTDKGLKNLLLRVDFLPPPPLSDEDRARGVAMAKLDRQAVFKGECASCHAKNVQGRYGRDLFVQVCAVCHEANPRATMVPDLHNLKDPTNDEFWRTWITSGKAGTLMPAFAQSQGGPLNNLQIASLATYLNSIIPPKVPPAAAR